MIILFTDFLVRRVDPVCRFEHLFDKYQTAVKKGDAHLAHHYWRAIFFKFNCQISPTAKLGSHLVFPHPIGIVIGDGVIIKDGCTIYQNVTLGQKNHLYPKLESGCTVYPNAVVMGDIVLRSGTVVGAGAVVTRGTDSPNDVIAGVPARSIKKKSTDAC